ncbi:unnamed protein product [Allacma fusca]|uniref:Uncharacterized protein n=1 Tax=Allacma fusca TaxID=39272 RepID=A0A8J2LGX3_9HEXA|nr:unnamed protein product [Allacma fusca]
MMRGSRYSHPEIILQGCSSPRSLPISGLRFPIIYGKNAPGLITTLQKLPVSTRMHSESDWADESVDLD